jgi:uncharacterized protein (TIGR00730 family)
MPQPARPFSVCVYCGSRVGVDPRHAAAAHALGSLIGARGARLVYGGGRVGLMGVVADAALAAGASVLGVIPRSLMEREVGHRGLSELQVVETMHQRKRLMAEQADAFVALPGGIGTLEELFEVWTWRQLGYHDQPIGLLNVAGYYDPLLAFMRRTERAGFVSEETLAMLAVDDAPERLLERLSGLARDARGPEDYRRT